MRKKMMSWFEENGMPEAAKKYGRQHIITVFMYFLAIAIVQVPTNMVVTAAFAVSDGFGWVSVAGYILVASVFAAYSGIFLNQDLAHQAITLLKEEVGHV